MGEHGVRDEGVANLRRRPHRNNTAAFKTKVAIQDSADRKTITETGQKHGVDPHQVTRKRRPPIERAVGVFWAPAVAEAQPVHVKALHTQIGRRVIGNDFTKSAISRARLLIINRRSTAIAACRSSSGSSR